MSQYIVNGFTWRGIWSSTVQYLAYDVVQYSGTAYVSVSTNLNVNPSTDGGSNWQVLAQAAGGSPQNVFIPYSSDFVEAGAGVNLAAASDIIVVPFTLPFSLAFSDITVNVAAADSGHDSDIGIYSLAGSLLTHTGPQIISSTGPQSFAVVGGPITLQAGTYLLAFSSAGTSLALYAAQIDGHYIWYYSTTTSSASGTLPSSISLATSFTTTPPAQFGGGGVGSPMFVLS